MTRFTTLAMASALALAVPTTLHAAPAQPVAAQVETAPTKPVRDDSAAERYADREAADRDVSSFEGGNTFVITMSGTTLALIIVLLLIL